MTLADLVADYLARQGVTDAFGIPGGVILDLIYALKHHPSIEPHLMSHEQDAGFAALGYAQSSRSIGVAYATRGPGFTNLITPIAEAYHDSIPSIFFTAHSSEPKRGKMRIYAEQEIDTCAIVRSITKFAACVENLADAIEALQQAVLSAKSGRPGPSLIDLNAGIWCQEVDDGVCADLLDAKGQNHCFPSSKISEINRCLEVLENAESPCILIGDGVWLSQQELAFQEFLERVQIPVVSSRNASKIINGSPLYYGYIGSHGIRAANFIISKADVILSLGNRLGFPLNSKSYKPFLEKRFIRIDIDEDEFERALPNAVNIKADLAQFFKIAETLHLRNIGKAKWIEKCDSIRHECANCDISDVHISIGSLISTLPTDTSIVCDVGNNEFLVSQAYVKEKINNNIYFSKSFGSLGSALGRGIGVYYATGKPILCFVGDQGLQMNIQELHYIFAHRLPITIAILNNEASGMIRDRQTSAHNSIYLHTTLNSGYSNPSFCDVAHAFNLQYLQYSAGEHINFNDLLSHGVVEIKLENDGMLQPWLRKGDGIENLSPKITPGIYRHLENL